MDPEEIKTEETQPEVIAEAEAPPAPIELGEVELKAILEAVIYITEEPLEAKQLAQALGQAQERVDAALAQLVNDYNAAERGLQIREIAGGYKMATKPEHHEAVRQFVKNLKPPLKLTGAALEHAQADATATFNLHEAGIDPTGKSRMIFDLRAP